MLKYGTHRTGNLKNHNVTHESKWIVPVVVSYVSHGHVSFQNTQISLYAGNLVVDHSIVRYLTITHSTDLVTRIIYLSLSAP